MVIIQSRCKLHIKADKFNHNISKQRGKESSMTPLKEISLIPYNGFWYPFTFYNSSIILTTITNMINIQVMYTWNLHLCTKEQQ